MQSAEVSPAQHWGKQTKNEEFVDDYDDQPGGCVRNGKCVVKGFPDVTRPKTVNTSWLCSHRPQWARAGIIRFVEIFLKISPMDPNIAAADRCLLAGVYSPILVRQVPGKL